jgi:hypothetical protein
MLLRCRFVRVYALLECALPPWHRRRGNQMQAKEARVSRDSFVIHSTIQQLRAVGELTGAEAPVCGEEWTGRYW